MAADWSPRALVPIHELSLMMALGERVVAVATREGAQRVRAIHLRVGRLAGVEPHALRLAAQIVLADTLAQGARLVIDEVPAIFWCAPCSAEFLAPDGYGPCPLCGAPSRALRQGRELTLHAVELEP